MSVKIEFENETLNCRLCGEIDHHTTLPIRLDIDEVARILDLAETGQFLSKT